MVKVICPKCGRVGYLIRLRVGSYRYFAVNHGDRICYLGRNPVLRVPYDRLKAFRFFGADTPLIDVILSLVPPHQTYVEVFGGSATVLLSKPPSRVDVYNDRSLDLYNLFLCYRDYIDEMVEEAKYILYHRALFKTFKEELRKPFKPPDPRRAVMFLATTIMSIDGRLGSGFSTSLTVNNSKHLRYLMEEHLRRVHRRLRRVVIECLDFEEVIRRYDSEDTWFYLDPPHIGNEGSYDGGFTPKDHERLYNLLTKVKGRWLLKYTYHPWVMEKYRDFSKVVVEYVKSSTIVKNSSRVKGRYVLIANYELPPNTKFLSRDP